ncbi:hypothetical protein DN603_09465 [Raoultella planticola]|uniref:Uncharacterized protein n=1 Tax=Raoultella planticola TaxID=575 RepID=A0A443VP74_RAOPL|nr:hypothetical protein DN603_09465 [Raoultella planticola]
MSIHRKDEKHGHYSVQISPSSSRVPWYGVAVLEPTQNGFLLDVLLEREVRTYATHLDLTFAPLQCHRTTKPHPPPPFGVGLTY